MSILPALSYRKSIGILFKIPLWSNKIIFKYHVGEVVLQARALNTSLKLIPSEPLRQSISKSFLQERQSQSMIPVVASPLPLLLHSLILKNSMRIKYNTQLLIIGRTMKVI
jgi:hypothetical protein